MAAKMTGMPQALSMLRNLGPATAKALNDANRENAAEIVRTAKLLVPSRSGATRAAIVAIQDRPDRILIDFGPKAKVIEGERGPRPFVNPALKFTAAARRKRSLAAVQKARRLAARGNA